MSCGRWTADAAGQHLRDRCACRRRREHGCETQAQAAAENVSGHESGTERRVRTFVDLLAQRVAGAARELLDRAQELAGVALQRAHALTNGANALREGAI